MTHEVGPGGGGGSVTFPILVSQGGTGATDAAGARANLGVSTASEIVETFTLTPTDITNKFVVLAQVPGVAAHVKLSTEGEVERLYGINYQMTADDGGKRLSWDGLALADVLVTDDQISVRYLV